MLTREKSVKSTESGEVKKHAGCNCEVPERAVGVGDGILHDLGDVVNVPPSL